MPQLGVLRGTRLKFTLKFASTTLAVVNSEVNLKLAGARGIFMKYWCKLGVSESGCGICPVHYTCTVQQ